MQFQLRTYNPGTGSVLKRTVEGENESEVQRQLEREGLTLLSIAAANPKFTLSRSAPFNVTLFCEELRTLLSSGMSLVETIETLSGKDSGNGSHTVLLELKQNLLEGKSLSGALTMSSFQFPPLLIASIKASERTSLIDQALDEYIAYEKIGRDLSKKIISAAIYPSLVVSFGLLVCLFMITYVVPRFAKVYEDFTPSLSFSTIALMKLGQFMGDHLALVILSFIGLVTGTLLAYRQGHLKRLFFLLLNQFAFARHYLRIYQLTRIYQTLSMLLKGGYTISDAIPLAQNLASEPVLYNQISAMRQSVTEGKRISSAFADNNLTDNVTERLLQVGERSGDLPKVLDIIALDYRQEFTRFVENATRLAEPILLMIVGVMIGTIIILMYMPVFDLAGGM